MMISIYIYTHKPFKPPFKASNEFKILTDDKSVKSDIKVLYEQDFSDNLTNLSKFYGEGSGIYCLYKSDNLPEYIGFCHYSRYFDFKIDEIEFLLSENEVLVHKPVRLLRNNRSFYGMCHNIDDYNVIGDIINEFYHEYYESFCKFNKNSIIYPCNMFIMKRGDFIEYGRFVFGVLSKFCDIKGFYSDKDVKTYIINNKKKYIKYFSPNNKVEYQQRLGGFLLERLSNVFYMKHFKSITGIPVRVVKQ